MIYGKMLKSGDVVLAKVQFTDTFEIKNRPAFVLFQELGNIVVMGITSNPKMKGIPLKKDEGAIKDSIIKINYIFTISDAMVRKKLFTISEDKKQEVKEELLKRLN